MQSIEKIGTFYLGKIVDPETGKLKNDYFEYDSKNLTTHAICVGMTGSGKTGLGIALLEEAALDKIPAIIIDPKGDLSNLLLTFPHLSPEEFKPWVDLAEAERKGMNKDEYADFIAKTWEKGLASWGENADRINKFKNSIDLAIYTPASQAGIPISILNSFAAPPKEQTIDPNALREKVLSLTASLLSLLGISADPVKSREQILISTIIQQAWQKGENLDISSLIQLVQKPPFNKIGALDIDTFFPYKDRLNLSIAINNLLASPGFQAWMEGQPLDIDKLLFSPGGKPKLSIISIAHLSDPERMFFVTLLLNEIVTWMRQQSGVTTLRAILYMDEIFGFFPPTAAPPSKLPMLTLLKQARAFGLGVVLCTQNPVDLDYKGLSNCGTWFIGKLQTERDKIRVLEGLKVASNGEWDPSTLDKMLALTGKRIFIMRSIHVSNPILFETRWTLSYLRGPLTLAQIATFKNQSQEALLPKAQEKNLPSSYRSQAPVGISEYFVYLSRSLKPTHYEPYIMALAKVHFVDSKCKVDFWEDLSFVVPSAEGYEGVNWEEGKNFPNLKDQLENEPIPGSTFAQLPVGLMQEKTYAQLAKHCAIALYQQQTLTLYQASDLDMTSDAKETENNFRKRAALEMNVRCEEQAKKIREKYADKKKVLEEKIKYAQQKMSQKQQKALLQKVQTLISFLVALVGALLGRGVTKGTVSQTGTSIRRATQIGQDSQDASVAESQVALYQKQLQDLEIEMNAEIATTMAKSNLERIKIETITLRPRKSDIDVEKVALAWWPQEKKGS